jgi:peptide/nickel transport system substrate-binding protein
VDDVSLVVGNGSAADNREAMMAIDSATLVSACEKVKNAIVADDATGTVTFTLAQPWAPFLTTIAQTWGSIMDMEWVIENGGWDGSCDTWQNFYAMQSADDPFSAIENGTGPFKIESYKPGEELVLTRHDSYWREPAKLERVILKQVDDWGTRFDMIQAGDVDSARVPSDNRFQMDELVGERCEFDLESNTFKTCEVVDSTKPLRVRIGRPDTIQNVILFNFNISPDNNP